MSKQTSLSVPAELSLKIDSRVDKMAGKSRSAQVVADLETYLALLDRGLAIARRDLTRAEAQLILDVRNGAWTESGQAAIFAAFSGLRHAVSDAIELDGVAEKWQVDGPALLAKLDALAGAPALAIIDWCAQMWAHSDDAKWWRREIDGFAE